MLNPMKMAAARALDHRRLWKASPNAYLVLSPDLRILDANPAWLAFVAGTRDEYVGHYLFDVLPPRMQETAREMRASFSRVIERGEVDSIPLLHYPVPLHDGGGDDQWLDRYWAVRSAPVFDDNGRVTSILNCPVDITDLVLAREAGDEPRAGDDPRGTDTTRRLTAQMAGERRRFR